ncbi:hypothetical protein ACROYT_G010833 [Oculina patagonica]
MRIQGKTREYRGIQGNTGEYRGIQGNTGEYRRKHGNTGEYRGIQGKTREYRGIQENDRRKQGNTGEYMRIQGNTGEYRGIQENDRTKQGNTGEYMRIQGNTGEYMRKQWNTGEYRRIQENTNASAFCSSPFAMNETDSFLAPVALKIYTRPRRMLWSFKSFSKLGTAHIFSRTTHPNLVVACGVVVVLCTRNRKSFYVVGIVVVFAWITWMAIYLTGAISGYISVKESTLRVGGWLTCTCMYKCTQLIHKSLRLNESSL